MIHFTLSVENLSNVRRATTANIERAIESLRSPTGPTYINLTGPDGSYAQAGGTNGRYVIESRDVYGEGFLHWRAGLPNVKDRSDVVMYFRNHCSVHGKRRCPLPAWGENVLTLSDVRAIMLFYQASGERLSSYPWEDVSQYCLDAALKGDSRFIREIRPQGADRRR